MLDLSNIIKYTSKLKLLYVEDDEEARLATRVILEEFFQSVVIASNGQEGLDLFKENDVDLIITDINMPKMNGLEMIKEIRKLDNEISILILSAYNESGFFMDSIKMGVEGYLLKPIDINQFVGMLEKVVQKLKLQDESNKNLHLLKQYQEATDHSSIVSKSDLKGRITYVNNEFCAISGYSREELIGQSHKIIRHPDVSALVYKEMLHTVKDKKQIWKGMIRNINKNKQSYYVKTTVKPILDQYGEIIEYISLRDDITDIMNPNRQMQDLIEDIEEPIVVLLKIESYDDIEKYYGQRLAQEIEDEFSREIFKLMPSNCEFERVFILGNGVYGFAKDKVFLR